MRRTRIVLQSQRSKTLAQRLEMVARELGWSDVRESTFFGLAVAVVEMLGLGG